MIKFNINILCKFKLWINGVFFAAVSSTALSLALVHALAILPITTHADEVSVPLQKEDWVVLSFNRIPANQVSFDASGMQVAVKDSAGPVVHKFPSTRMVTEFSVKGKFRGNKKKESGDFDEDSALRMGFVAVGNKTLSGPKSWFAADWVKKLFALAPKNTGLSQIFFYNVTNRSSLVGKTRVHPSSDLMVESIFAMLPEDGEFNLNKKFSKPIETVALWISIDGDNSKSQYTTSIESITLVTPESALAK